VVTKGKLRTGSYDMNLTIRDLRSGHREIYGNGSYDLKVTKWEPTPAGTYLSDIPAGSDGTH
jgi:hypothetical protein